MILEPSELIRKAEQNPLILDRSDLAVSWMTLDGSAQEGLRIPLPRVLCGAVARRCGEYRAGRYCAGIAMNRLGAVQPGDDRFAEHWPRMGADRAPVWQSGVVGSITHSTEKALCAVAWSAQVAGLGVDLERPVTQAEAEALAPLIATPKEITIAAQAMCASHAFTALFSAKEALYKALYPTVKRFVDFSEATAVWASPGEIRFALAPELAAQCPAFQSPRVKVEFWQGHVLSLCLLKPPISTSLSRKK